MVQHAKKHIILLYVTSMDYIAKAMKYPPSKYSFSMWVQKQIILFIFASLLADMVAIMNVSVNLILPVDSISIIITQILKSQNS